DPDAPLIQLQPCRAVYVLLSLIDQSLQRLTLGREPMTVVHHLGVARAESVAQMHHLAIERELLNRATGVQKDSYARTFVHSARLDTDIAVLDQIDPPDAVTSADFVGAFD